MRFSGAIPPPDGLTADATVTVTTDAVVLDEDRKVIGRVTSVDYSVDDGHLHVEGTIDDPRIVEQLTRPFRAGSFSLPDDDA